MVETRETIKSKINAYIKAIDSNYSNWYVGIATYPEARLFQDHNVDENNGSFIYKEAMNSKFAREIEEYFIEQLGTDGGTGGGDESTKYIYAYKKTSHTKE